MIIGLTLFLEIGLILVAFNGTSLFAADSNSIALVLTCHSALRAKFAFAMRWIATDG